jgi:hypothetical protein
VSKPENGVAAPDIPAGTEIDSSDITSTTEYKKIAPKTHNYCPYQCSSCKTVGNSLLKIQFDNFKHILLEDDSKLIFNFFGRDLIK